MTDRLATETFVLAHAGAHVSDTDPGAIGAGREWLQTLLVEYAPETQLWVRNASDDGWLPVGFVLFDGNGLPRADLADWGSGIALRAFDPSQSEEADIIAGYAGGHPFVDLSAPGGEILIDAGGTEITATGDGAYNWIATYGDHAYELHEVQRADYTLVASLRLDATYGTLIEAIGTNAYTQIQATGDSAHNEIDATGAAAYNDMYALGDNAYNGLYATGTTAYNEIYASGLNAYNLTQATGVSAYNQTRASGDAAANQIYATGAGAYNLIEADGATAYNQIYASGTSAYNEFDAYGAAAFNLTHAVGADAYNEIYASGVDAFNWTHATGDNAYNEFDAVGTNAYNEIYASGDSAYNATQAQGAGASNQILAIGANASNQIYASGASAFNEMSAGGDNAYELHEVNLGDLTLVASLRLDAATASVQIYASGATAYNQIEADGAAAYNWIYALGASAYNMTSASGAASSNQIYALGDNAYNLIEATGADAYNDIEADGDYAYNQMGANGDSAYNAIVAVGDNAYETHEVYRTDDTLAASLRLDVATGIVSIETMDTDGVTHVGGRLTYNGDPVLTAVPTLEAVLDAGNDAAGEDLFGVHAINGDESGGAPRAFIEFQTATPTVAGFLTLSASASGDGTVGGDVDIDAGNGDTAGGVYLVGGSGTTGHGGGQISLEAGYGDGGTGTLPAQIHLNGGQVGSPGRMGIITDGVYGAAGAVLTADGTGTATWQSTHTVVAFVIDGGGAVITTGVKGDISIPFACTIVGVRLLADQTGSIRVDLWKAAYASFPPTSGNHIDASAPSTISGAVKAEDTTLTGWSTAVSAGDVLRFNVYSCSAITRCSVALDVVR
jgi:hypothetical protein